MIFSGSYLWVYLFGSLVLGAVMELLLSANQMTLATMFLFVTNRFWVSFVLGSPAYAMRCSLGFFNYTK
jgi:hypothetical protein